MAGEKTPLHILESQQFSRQWLEDEFFPETGHMEQVLQRGGSTELRRRSIAVSFYEPSTRTRMSFEQAAAKLGATVVSTENAKDSSSAVKGETVEDMTRVINSMGFDGLVMRHYEEGAAKRAAAVSAIPVINAGDGPGEHPTQALLDLYTIKKQFGIIDDLRISLVGDLQFSRTTRSLAHLLGKFRGIHFNLVAPESLQMSQAMLDQLRQQNISFEKHQDLAAVAGKSDVIYLTRAQTERMTYEAKQTFERQESKGVRITQQVLDTLPAQGIVMHPLPRSTTFGELPDEYTDNPHVKIFEQVKNGVPTRMAVLAMTVGDSRKKPRRS